MTDAGVSPASLTPIEVLDQKNAAAATVATLQSVTGITSVAVPTGARAASPGMTTSSAIPNAETVNNETLAPVHAAKQALAHRPGVIGRDRRRAPSSRTTRTPSSGNSR